MGAGVQLFADLLGHVQVDLRLADRQVTQRAARVDFPTKFSPTAGLLYSPTRRSRLGLSWRQGTSLKFYIPSRLVLDDLAILDFNVGGVVLYTPDALHFGGAYSWEDIGLQVSMDAGWYRWSTAPDPSMGISLNADGAVLSGLGIEERLDLEGPEDIDLAFRDIVVFKFGLEWTVVDQWFFRSGYSFRPGPAPIPTGAYNYLDSKSHRFGAGLGYTVMLDVGEFSRALHFDFAYAATVLPETEVPKQNGQDDPIGNYRSGGTVHGISFNVRHVLRRGAWVPERLVTSSCSWPRLIARVLTNETFSRNRPAGRTVFDGATVRCCTSAVYS